MVNKLLSRGRDFLSAPQTSVASAAGVIMVMIIASRILGLVRQRTLAFYFPPGDLSLFFAAFRLPDLIFEVLVFGTFSSAFIPVFTRAIKNGERDAWDIAGRVVNIGLLVFIPLAGLIAFFSTSLYSTITPGFKKDEVEVVANLARILFAAQGFFVISYVLTGVLESLRRFLIPALAPIFYNLGIILGTIFLSPSLGLYAPAVGVVIGAACHLLIQLPLALKLGFKLTRSIRPNKEVLEIGKLSAPRLLDLSVEEVQKTAELFLASLISKASYTYFTLAGAVQVLPVNLFGTSLAKAALPTLSALADSKEEFRRTLFTTLNQIIFLIAPVATILIVLRIPIIRLVFGTDMFDWEATVQTGVVLSVFAVGSVFQAAIALLERGFYALQDTKTPVAVSVATISFMVVLDFVLVRGLGLPVWALAASFTVSVFAQSLALFYFLNKRLSANSLFGVLLPSIKAIAASLVAGGVMYILLKLFDRSVWVKQISFLGKLGAGRNVPFERFVLDTRYTFNLIVLTFFVALVGGLTYLLVSVLLKSEQVAYFLTLLKKIVMHRVIPLVPQKEPEPVTQTPPDSTTT